MSDLQQGMDCPWFSSYDKGVPHDIVIPEGGLQNILDTAAETYGQREAIVFQNTHISYKELKELAEKLAASLRRRGVRPGDRVSIMLPNLPQTFIAFWGVMKAGAVAVMTNPLYMESELTHQIKDSGAKHLITLDIFWPKIAALREQLELDVCYVTRVRDALKFPLSWLQPFSARRQGTWVPVPFDGKEVVAWKDLFKTTERLSVEVTDAHETIALLQYTGGTTGLSKGAMLTHANLLANLTQLMAIIQQPPEKEHVFLALLPLFHVFGCCPQGWPREWSPCRGMSPPTCWRHSKSTSSRRSSALLPSIFPCCSRRIWPSTICTISYSVFRDQPPCLSNG